jgi:adenosylhomocysteine nucleosidase
MKKLGIVAAMKVEIELLLEQMTNQTVREYSGARFFTGKISDCEAVIVECGIGKVNSALRTQVLIDRFGVDMLLNTGIAGGISPELKQMSVVVSDKLTYHDVDRGQMFSVFPDGEWFFADRGVVSVLNSCAGEDAHFGVIATGDTFVSDSAVKNRIYRELDALCVDMEGASVAHTALINGIPFAAIRCISDMADEEAPAGFFEFEKTASNRSADIIIKALPLLKAI